MPATTTLTELSHRRNDGLDVALLWDRADGTVRVRVQHIHTGAEFDIPVPGDRALDAFHHPFAYAAVSASADAELELDLAA
jgi:hypothetical protein